MLSSLIVNSVVVFAITLTITKSKIFACKREFIEKRYQQAKINKNLTFVHTWWRAVATCAMCSGFYFSILVSLYNPVCGLIIDTLFAYGMNWLLHCLESVLFNAGKKLE